MSDLFASGWLVDLILLIVLIEAVGLIAYRRMTGRGVAPRDLLPSLAAGALLLLALRLTLAEVGWIAVCACLAASGVAHGLDLVRRWRK